MAAMEVRTSRYSAFIIVRISSDLFFKWREKKEYSRITAIVLHICLLFVAEARPSKFLASLQKASVAQWLLPIRQMLKNVQFEIFSSDFRLTFQRLFSCFWFYI